MIPGNPWLAGLGRRLVCASGRRGPGYAPGMGWGVIELKRGGAGGGDIGRWEPDGWRGGGWE